MNDEGYTAYVHTRAATCDRAIGLVMEQLNRCDPLDSQASDAWLMTLAMLEREHDRLDELGRVLKNC